MIEGVPGRIHHPQCEIANAEVAFEFEVPIVGNAACWMGVDRRAGFGGKQRGRRGVIGVAVGDGDGANRHVEISRGLEERLDVARDRRTGIDDQRRVTGRDDVRVRPVERQGRRIGRANEGYHRFSSVAGITNVPSSAVAGRIVKIALRRAKSCAWSSDGSGARRSRCLIVG